jgi:hypothetical protein
VTVVVEAFARRSPIPERDEADRERLNFDDTRSARRPYAAAIGPRNECTVMHIAASFIGGAPPIPMREA